MMDFSSRVVMITGAAGGIGRGLCAYFHEAGARVLAFSREAEELDALCRSVAPGSPRLWTAHADLTRYDEVIDAVARVVALSGPVDILINNAGGAAATALSNTTPQSFRADLDLNLTAAYHCVEAVKQPMFARSKGVIINIGSVNSEMALGHPAYSAAKAGLVSYTRSLAVEYGPRGVRANIICPGTVKTEAWKARAARNPQIFDDLKKWYPLRNFAEPLDIAHAAAFLASDAARMISGVVLPVDAGLTAGNAVLARELTLEEF